MINLGISLKEGKRKGLKNVKEAVRNTFRNTPRSKRSECLECLKKDIINNASSRRMSLTDYIELPIEEAQRLLKVNFKSLE